MMKSLDDLEHYYQFFASIAGINPKYNGFDGFHTWEAINQITDGKNLGNCEKFLKAQMASIEKRKKIIERELIVESLHTLNDHEDISSKQAQSERNEKAIPISDIIAANRPVASILNASSVDKASGKSNPIAARAGRS